MCYDLQGITCITIPLKIISCGFCRSVLISYFCLSYSQTNQRSFISSIRVVFYFFCAFKKFLSINAASSEAFCSNQAVCFSVRSLTFALSLTRASSSFCLVSASKAVSVFSSLSSFVICAFCF